MKARLDDEGILAVERNGVWARQGCPFRDPCILEGQVHYPHCGHWCPLFIEEKKVVYLQCAGSTTSTMHRIAEDLRSETSNRRRSS